MSPLALFWMVLKASLFSTGGFGNVPTIHADVVGGGIASESTFAESLAVGQISPGPNGLWVVSLGYLLSRWWGAILATIAIALPPLLVIWIERQYRKIHKHPAVEGFVRGLSLAVVGNFAVVMIGLFLGFKNDTLAVAVCVIAFLAVMSKRVPVLIVILGSAAFGILVGR
jgi:chromate transporter